MFWAAFTLAFFGFLRSSEFTCNDKVFDPETDLCLKDVTFVPNIESPNYMLVLIKRSKTDPFPNGCTLTLARSTTSICAVMAMKDYVLQCQPSSTGPLFTFTSGKWLTRTSLTHKLVTSCSNAAYNLNTISHIASVLAPRLLQLLQGFLPG